MLTANGDATCFCILLLVKVTAKELQCCGGVMLETAIRWTVSMHTLCSCAQLLLIPSLCTAAWLGAMSLSITTSRELSLVSCEL